MGGKAAIETYEEKRGRVQEFNLTSDVFSSKVFEDMAACQELCRVLMQNSEIILRNVKTQYVIRNLESHSVQLDILAEEVTGNIINVEFQMYAEDMPFRRTRYYTSCIDVSILEKGKGYYGLPDVTVAYITREDFIGGKRGFYQIGREVIGNRQTAKVSVDNGYSEKYFNLEYSTADEKIDELLGYLKHSDPFYRTEHFPRIVERVNYFKIQREGVEIMCEIADRIRREGKIEGKIEGRIESIMELLEELGKVPSQIAQRINEETNLSILSKWHKCAAAASSIAEFEARM